MIWSLWNEELNLRTTVLSYLSYIVVKKNFHYRALMPELYKLLKKTSVGTDEWDTHPW